MAKITLSSLNVRGLANDEKRRELFYWLKKKIKFFLFICYKKFIVRKSLLRIGQLNGAIQLYSVV